MRVLDALGEPDGRPQALVLRALALGDLLVAVPALHGLRRGLPGHRLVLAAPAWLAPVVALVPGIDALLPVSGLDAPLPPGVVDVAVNLHGRGPQSHRVLDALSPRRRIGYRTAAVRLGPEEAALDGQSGRDTPRNEDPTRSSVEFSGWEGPDWIEQAHERERWAGLVAAYGMPADPDEVAIALPEVPSRTPGAVAVHVGAGYGSRQWPTDRFAAVARRLASDGERVVVTGGAGDVGRAAAVAEQAGLGQDAVLAGRLDLTQFAATVAAARLVVTGDTGAAHLASAYRRPSVVLFGPATPEQWGPPASGPHLVLTDPSVRVGDVFEAEPDPALLAVTADDVLAALRRLL